LLGLVWKIFLSNPTWMHTNTDAVIIVIIVRFGEFRFYKCAQMALKIITNSKFKHVKLCYHSVALNVTQIFYHWCNVEVRK
jgi:hypothetical protein